MRTADFHFDLPPELIAQHPAPKRDQSRLFVLHRETGRFEHRGFRDLPDFLCAGDTLVLNNSRVIRARLRGVNAKTGGAFELLLLEETATNDWWAMLKPGKRADLIMVSTRGISMGVFTDPAQLVVEAAEPANVDTVVVDGRILKRAGALTAISESELVNSVAGALDSLRKRVGES